MGNAPLSTTDQRQLRPLLSKVDDLIDACLGHHLRQTAFLLKMARLDIVNKINGVSDEEFYQFCEQLQARSISSEARSLREDLVMVEIPERRIKGAKKKVTGG
jgi:hypothetical protein